MLAKKSTPCKMHLLNRHSSSAEENMLLCFLATKCPIFFLNQFISEIKLILSTLLLSPAKSPPQFDLLPSLMQDNTLVLDAHNFSMDNLIPSHLNSELSYGSKFYPESALELLLKCKSNQNRIKYFLNEGFSAYSYPMCNQDNL